MAEMVRHVKVLAHSGGVTVVEKGRGSGRAWRKKRLVHIPPILSAVTYAVALHELGHVLGPRGTARVERELLAWEWAREVALEWDARHAATAHDRLVGYARWARRRGQQFNKRGRPRQPEAFGFAARLAAVRVIKEGVTC